MDGFGKTLFWFNEEDLLIEVPFFQRPYVWDEDNWQSLIDSIESSDDKRMPFIGSFILQEKSSKVYWVIDGQQRITTLSVFIRAFLDQTKYPLISHVITKLEGMIYKTELIDGENVSYKSRLIPSNADSESFEKVMSTKKDDASIDKGKSNIEDCYLYFRDYIDGLSIEDFKKIRDKLITSDKYIIAITLDSKDDEQAIFDTVNSLGKRLTNSDIVKNYLYQKMKSFAGDNTVYLNDVLEHYKKYWQKIFISGDARAFWDKKISLGRMTTTNLDAFLKDYATIKEIYVPSASGGIEGLAKEYKRFIDKLDRDSLNNFSIELADYAKVYFDLWNNYDECNDFRISDKINTTLLLLDRLETSTFNPYILKLLKNRDSDLDDKLFGLQKFVLRRFLWKASAKNYNKCCLEVLKSSDPNKYLENYNLQTEGIDWSGYPTQLKNLKNSQGTLLLFLIEMIRRHSKGEDNYGDSLSYNMSLEHILPQKWKEHWKDVPSYKIDDSGEFIKVSDEEKEANRKIKIPSIGNMALLTVKLNASISNDEFKVKINGKSGKKGIRPFVGNLSVTSEIVNGFDIDPKWDERNIVDREVTFAKELNEYYDFCEEIKAISDDSIDFDLSKLTLEYFDDTYYDKTRVGSIARESFMYLLANNILNEEEIALLKTQEYSSRTFGVWLPLFCDNESNLYDGAGRRRYYKNSISKDKKIYLCREWYERNRLKLVSWVKARIH